MALRNCTTRLMNHHRQTVLMPLSDGTLCRPLWLSSRRLHSRLMEAVANAEKVAGNPTFLRLETVGSHEISNMSIYLTKLMETGHPLTATVQRLMAPENQTDLSRGLIVWLISQAAKCDPAEGILPEQKRLAEITQLIYVAHEIHSGIMNLATPNEDLELGNKIAILCGDFIQSRSSIQLAAFRNLRIIDLYGQAISDFSASEFVELVSDEKNSALDKWKQQTKMRYGTLLAHSCQSTLILGNNTELLRCGKHFGHEMALAWQANVTLQSYEKATNKGEHVLAKVFPGASVQEVGSRFQVLRDNHVDAALDMANEFPENEAKNALCNIARALKC
ncbi:all trans-polyprenyl-diphosphate synthase PDSS2-like [Daphnia carinata]|uniref:all trans-polyprenyl-diphosphate synthase PDSS2-like n=1 Tax=Daphnia carinata TaxID=120202 RepID=UPI00257EC235|nr:all trans-polyprenyl-diphosphate synthase PDSS2-like [Daphnia carinata]